MVNTEDKNATAASINEDLLTDKESVGVLTSEPVIKDIGKYFVKDILNILEKPTMKGKTKLKEIRRKMYGYLK